MSALTSATARSWSRVSSYGNDASSSACHGVSGAKAWPWAAARAAYSSSSSSARSSTALRDALLRPRPLLPPSLVSGRLLAARVAGDPVDLLDRHEDPVAAGELQLQVVALLAGAAAPEHLLVARDAVVDVDDEVAGRQALEDVARARPAGAPAADGRGPSRTARGR